MSLSYVSVTTAQAYGSGDVTTGSIAIQTGDLICVAGMMNSSSKTVDGVSNSGTAISWNLLTTQDRARLAWGVALASESITITVDFAAYSAWGNVIVYVFRPDSGDTISLEAELTGNTAAGGDGTDIATGEATFTETDVVVFAAATSSSSSSDVIDPEIPIGTAANGDTDLGSGQYRAFYSLFTSGQSGLEAQVTRSGGYATVSIVGAVFKSVSSGGAGNPYYAYAQQ